MDKPFDGSVSISSSLRLFSLATARMAMDRGFPCEKEVQYMYGRLGSDAEPLTSRV